MPDESAVQVDGCSFCDREAFQRTLLHETENFYVVADFAPVADAHFLLIPRRHFRHLAALPPELDDEFHGLKAMLGSFVQEHYGRVTYWENGIFGQSVPHAHLHSISVDLDTMLFEQHGSAFSGLPSLRIHQETNGDHYFLVEHAGVGRVMPPDPELYGRIIRHARTRNGGMWNYSPPERRMHGRPITEAMVERWRSEMTHLPGAVADLTGP